MGAKRIRQLVVVCAIVAVAALAAGSPAYGKGCAGNLTNEGPSSVAQYTEQIPTACGKHVTGTGKGTRKLPASTAQKIQEQGGSDATLLKNIATSAKFGAPTQKIKVKGGPKHNRFLGDRAATRSSNPLSASVSVVTDGSDARLIALVVLMLGIAVLVLATAVRRRRVTR
jgi:MYXO-CTERM domain-containing protein